jgi:hypothetical protein
LTQPLHQLSRRQVHHFHRVSVVEYRIGHGLPHLHAGYLSDYVVQALQVLHVEGRVHVDARAQQLLHVLPSFRVSGAGSVRMRKFVHEKQSGAPMKGRIEIQLLKIKASVLEEQGRQNLQSLQKHLCLRPPMRLHVPRHHVHPGRRKMLCRLQHGVGLADAGNVAEEDLQRAPVRP